MLTERESQTATYHRSVTKTLASYDLIKMMAKPRGAMCDLARASRKPVCLRKADAETRTDLPTLPSTPVASTAGGTGGFELDSRPIGASSVSHALAGGWAAAEDRASNNNEGRRVITSIFIFDESLFLTRRNRKIDFPSKAICSTWVHHLLGRVVPTTVVNRVVKLGAVPTTHPRLCYKLPPRETWKFET